MPTKEKHPPITVTIRKSDGQFEYDPPGGDIDVPKNTILTITWKRGGGQKWKFIKPWVTTEFSIDLKKESESKSKIVAKCTNETGDKDTKTSYTLHTNWTPADPMLTLEGNGGVTIDPKKKAKKKTAGSKVRRKPAKKAVKRPKTKKTTEY